MNQLAYLRLLQNNQIVLAVKYTASIFISNYSQTSTVGSFLVN